MFTFDKFFEYLEKLGLSEKQAETKLGIPRAQMQRMRHNKGMSIYTMNKLCNTLECRPEDIREYVPDDDKYFPEE